MWRLVFIQQFRNFIISFFFVRIADLTNGSSTVTNGNSAMANSLASNGVAVTPCAIKAPLVVTIVGPPCRGKSLAAHKISRNLFWKGEDVKGEAFLILSFLCNLLVN